MGEWIKSMTVGELIAWITAWIAGIGALVLSIKKIAPVIKRIVHFLDDWNGETARPGVEARPGFPARIAQIEVSLDKVHHEVHPNSGLSLRDSVDRIEKKVGEFEGAEKARDGRVDKVERDLRELLIRLAVPPAPSTNTEVHLSTGSGPAV